MSTENVRKLIEIIEGDVELQEAIREKERVYHYENKEASAEEAFNAIIQPIAKEKGLEITIEEALEYIAATTYGELSDDELEKIAGGFMFCVGVGITSEKKVGFGQLDTGGHGAVACHGFGVGAGLELSW